MQSGLIVKETMKQNLKSAVCELHLEKYFEPKDKRRRHELY